MKADSCSITFVIPRRSRSLDDDRLRLDVSSSCTLIDHFTSLKILSFSDLYPAVTWGNNRWLAIHLNKENLRLAGALAVKCSSVY